MMVGVTTASCDMVGTQGKCASCGAAVLLVAPEVRPTAEPIATNVDGSAHASTCAKRVKVAQLVTTKRKSEP